MAGVLQGGQNRRRPGKIPRIRTAVVPALLLLLTPAAAALPSYIAPSCTWIQGQDYSPTSSHGTVTAASKEACCAACQKYTTCKVGVYQASSSKCFLKGGHVTPAPHLKDGIVACVARHNPKPSPPYDCSTPAASCASRLGATHWNPCYFINASTPVLIDGARSLASMGARVIKVALFDPAGNYPFNSPLWPNDPETQFPTLASMAKHPYYRELWSMPDFDTYVLIAYSTVGGTAGGDISYWTQGISPAQLAEETKQLEEAAAFLLATYPTKTFIFENWEGDWASRAGGYNGNQPATNLSLSSMTKWLAARQAGVTQARAERDQALLEEEEESKACAAALSEACDGAKRASTGNCLVCSRLHDAVLQEAKCRNSIIEAWCAMMEPLSVVSSASPTGNVLFAAEVNLVETSRTTGFPNMVNKVLPFVPLDMVSYSSYDSQMNPETLPKALDFIAANHQRTAASPAGKNAVFIAEYGVAQNQAPNATVVSTVENVVNTGLAWGVSYAIFWETFDNECSGGVGCSGGRCHDAAHPVTDPKFLHGFWLTKPDGSHSWPYTYLKSKIAEGSGPDKFM